MARPVRTQGETAMSLGKRFFRVLGGALLVTAVAPVASDHARADLPFCAYDGPMLTSEEVVVVDCLPSVADCAQGRAPKKAVLRNSTAFAFCEVGTEEGGPLIRWFSAGMVPDEQGSICGVRVENDILTFGRHGMYIDPNECPARWDPTKPVGQRFRTAAEGAAGAVASPDAEATAAGLSILESGGNAIDAAAATVFALTATSPAMCGIGGGGFLVTRQASSGKVRTLDFRETAPAAMRESEDLFVKDADGTLSDLIAEGSGPRVVGVPGTVAGMDEALRELGSKSLREVLEPAIGLARSSTTPMDLPNLLLGSGGDAFRARLLRLRDLGYGEAARILLPVPNPKEPDRPYPPVPGSLLVQPELAADLEEIAELGPAAFYDVDAPGTIAEDLIALMADSRLGKAADDPTLREVNTAGLMTADDLRSYRPVWRRPLSTTYGGHEVFVPPPPSSGGIQLLEMLNILESPGRDDGRPGTDLGEWGYGSADWAHHLIEAAKIAMADRDAHVGDPAFVHVPVSQLIDPTYGTTRREEIGYHAKTQYEPYDAGATADAGTDGRSGGNHTAHVSVIDRRGNAVAVTCTIEQAWGSGVIAPGTGFLLNNELTDFVDPGEGTDPNEPAPGKRPRSNMTPFLVVNDLGHVVLAAGGAGGGKIPIGSLHMVVNVVDHGMGLGEAVDVARVTLEPQQKRRVEVESPRLPLLQKELEARSHEFYPPHPFLLRGWEYAIDGPYMQLVGERLTPEGSLKRYAASDPRWLDYGAAAER